MGIAASSFYTQFSWLIGRLFDLLRLRDSNGKPFVFSVKAHYGSSLPILTEDKAYMMLWPVNVEVLNGDPEIKQTPGYE